MAKMFSSLRMRSHKRARPGSIATSASSDDTNVSHSPSIASGFLTTFATLDENGCTAPTSLSSKVAQVRVDREGGSLGVTLRGSAGRALVVTAVRPDGPAAWEGRVRPGDRLLAVDDAQLRGLSLADAQRALRRRPDAAPTTSSLTIEYDVADMSDARAACSGPLLVQLERAPNGELGIGVRECGGDVYIESLRPASTADRCGALLPGDRLMAVDDTAVHDAPTAAQLLRNISDNCRIARLQIVPRAPSVQSRTIKRRAQPQAHKHNTLTAKERLTILLRPDHRGLGIGLKRGPDALSYVVDLLEPGGPAERSGVLLPGDAIIAINRRTLTDLQPSDVALMLDAPQVELVVEYGVGGAVVPTSGVFTVRVARPGGVGPDLGLTVNEQLQIAEVRRGSLAYRTGSLAPGDILLAIDSEKLDPSDLHHAAQLLHRPGSSVVSLTVRKPDLAPLPSESGSVSNEPAAQFSTAPICSGRESLPSVDSAVDSWADMADVVSPDIAALWETGSVDSTQLDLPMPPYPYPSSCTSSSPHRAWSCSPAEKRSPQQQQPQQQQQIVHVSLHKDPVYEDFGFSVSDGLFERGVYINRLRPGGPCDGLLRPYDRILRVNDASTEDCDCCLAVPLIAAAGARLELTVARPISPSDQVTKLF